MKIKIKKLSNKAKLPTRKRNTDAGYDLYAANGCNLGRCATTINTDIAMEIPQGYYGEIKSRSGLAANEGIETMGGVIDSSFRGNIGIILINHNVFHDDDPEFVPSYRINAGDKIAQIIFRKCYDVEFEEVKELEESDRGEKGFGSSGLI